MKVKESKNYKTIESCKSDDIVTDGDGIYILAKDTYKKGGEMKIDGFVLVFSQADISSKNTEIRTFTEWNAEGLYLYEGVLTISN